MKAFTISFRIRKVILGLVGQKWGNLLSRSTSYILESVFWSLHLLYLDRRTHDVIPHEDANRRYLLLQPSLNKDTELFLSTRQATRILA